eukprot:1612307-Pyramimonas_sp.AAC.1
MILRALNFLHPTRAGGELQCCGSHISMFTHQTRLPVDSRARLLELGSQNYYIIRVDTVSVLHLTRAVGGFRAGNHMSGFADIRRAR